MRKSKVEDEEMISGSSQVESNEPEIASVSQNVSSSSVSIDTTQSGNSAVLIIIVTILILAIICALMLL
ncbi:MAG: hypothetical protein RR764_06045, partial [Oscillospiraceae bacterium]